MIKQILSLIYGSTSDQRQIDDYRLLMRREAELGGQVFGPIPKGRRREFFCLDKNTWIWHEEWIDIRGFVQSKTTRYDVRSSGILKAQGDSTYHKVSGEEAVNLKAAAEVYIKRSLNELYGVPA